MMMMIIIIIMSWIFTFSFGLAMALSHWVRPEPLRILLLSLVEDNDDCLPWQTWQGQERRFQELDLIIIKDLSSRLRIEPGQRAVKFRNKYLQLVNG